jgi:hypothetical protein
MRQLTLFFLFAALLVSCHKTEQKNTVEILLCNIHSGLCEGRLSDGIPVRFDITPKPVRSLEALQFSVYIEGLNDAKVTVDLTMPAMYMGENKISLVPAGEGKYTGKGSIVKCTSGDRLWDAAVIIEHPEKSATIHFRFETAP